MASELRQRIVALALADPAGTTADIAQAIGCSVWTVAAALKDARRAGVAVPRRPRRPLGCRAAVELRLAGDVHDALHEAAEARETSLARLVRQLVSRAARDGLIDAILDDGGADA